MIAFNQIPLIIRVPGQYIEFDNSRALQGLSAVYHKILVIGQRHTTGTIAANVPKRVLSAAQAEEYWGRGAMLTDMVAALKEANSLTECWAVALDDNGAGNRATGTITFTGTPTESGTLNLYIAGKRIQIGITSGQAVAAIATNVANAVNADTSLQVTAAAALGVVTLTARHRGECGNYIDVRTNYFFSEKSPKGLNVAIVAMSGGTANPSISTALAAIGDEQYHTIVMPYTDTSNLVLIESALTDRWGPMVMKEGHCFSAASGTHSTIDTLGASRNSPHLTIMGTGKSPTPPWIWASVLGAVDALESDPARPRQTLELRGCLPPAESDRFTYAERNILLFDGISTHMVDQGGVSRIEKIITTYQTNPFGVEDISYLNVERMRTLAYLRYDSRAMIALKFPRHKLANDGTRFGAGQPVVTPSIIRDEFIARFDLWEAAGLVEDRPQFIRDLLVQRHDPAINPNRVDAIIPPNCINGFEIFAGQVQFRV